MKRNSCFLLLAVVLSLVFSLTAWSAEISEGYVRLHYYRYDQNYDGWGLHIWGSSYAGAIVDWNEPAEITGFDEYGAYWDIPYLEGASDLNFIIHRGDEKDTEADREYPDPDSNREVWAVSDDGVAYTGYADAVQGIGDLFEKNTYKVGQVVNPLVPIIKDSIPTDPLAVGEVRLHYRRPDGDYEDWGLHVWGTGYAGPAVNWNDPVEISGFDEYGAYWDIPYNEGVGDLNFIIHKGDLKDPDPDRDYPDPDNNKEIWSVSGDVKAYTSLSEAKRAAGNIIVQAFITGPKSMVIEFREPIHDPIFIRDGYDYIPLLRMDTSEEPKYKLTLRKELDYGKTYKIECGALIGYTSLSWELIDEEFAYDGKLGANYDGEQTIFKLWAPLADNVKLLLFENGDDNQPTYVKDMEEKERGVWELTVGDDWLGWFYQYQVIRDGQIKTILDPYAKSMAAFADDGADPVGKAAVVDPSKLGPKDLDFAQIDGFEKREDAIIWEIHVRDFTSDPSLQTKAQFGTYKAFIEKLDYIQELGVTHVQLLPVLNYYFGNELLNYVRELEYSAQGNNYNWGYDPHNYFTPEGMYSENPADPELRIAELKELIHEIHKRGMGVILDVVYNHTARMGIFEDIIPGYYHFMDEQGNPKSSYGGGLLGSTHAMTRKMIVDSLTYWVDEYKVDGFRFDLMGDMDAETVQIAADAAAKLNPNLVIIGEGWITYSGDDGDRRVAADQMWMNQTDSAASFSDELRNEIKSGFGSEGDPRFITGGRRSIMAIFNNIKGDPSNMTADVPGDVVQYIAAHDNLTLHDVIAYAIRKDPALEKNQIEIQKRIRLGNAVVLTSQGISFLHAGQEYGRTKQWLAAGRPEDKYTVVDGFEHPYFIHDSYDSTDIINMFDWDKVSQEGIHRDTMEYTRGLIDLRRSTDAFRLGNAALVNQNVKLIDSRDIDQLDVAVAYSAKSTNGETYYVFINGDSKRRKFRIDLNLTKADILVDANTAGTIPITKPEGVKVAKKAITIDPLTVVVLKTK